MFYFTCPECYAVFLHVQACHFKDQQPFCSSHAYVLYMPLTFHPPTGSYYLAPAIIELWVLILTVQAYDVEESLGQ